MKGTIQKLVGEKNFGFIKGVDKIDYFFHRDDFNGHWDDLVTDHANGDEIEVTFVIKSPQPSKGARAEHVSRTRHPNEA